MAAPNIRSTKLVATIGPACNSVPIIREMIAAGMNVARLNLSHATHADHAELAAKVREAAADLGVPVAIMADTKGAEVRTGVVQNGRVELVEGAPFTLTTEARTGDAAGVSVSHPGLPSELSAGSAVFLDDGRIELRVERVSRNAIECRVVKGGALGNRKGLNAPGARLNPAAMGRDDLEDLLFTVKLDVDYLAASFVKSAADVLVIREILRGQGAAIPIIAKIENRQAVATLDVLKSMEMFKKVNVPLLGIIENMAYFIAPDTGARYDIFGSGGAARLAAQIGIPLLGQIPLGISVMCG